MHQIYCSTYSMNEQLAKANHWNSKNLKLTVNKVYKYEGWSTLLVSYIRGLPLSYAKKIQISNTWYSLFIGWLKKWKVFWFQQQQVFIILLHQYRYQKKIQVNQRWFRGGIDFIIGVTGGKLSEIFLSYFGHQHP